MIVSQDKYAHRVLEPRMVIGVLAFVLTNGVYGQIVFDDKCTTPIMHLAYVRSFSDRNEKALPSEESLAKLLCIAKEDESPLLIGVARNAVRAIVAIAEDDEESRKYLLDIALDPNVRLEVHEESCRLLTLVSDVATTQAIMNRLSLTWPRGHWQGYFQLLRDVGDASFLSWLDGQIESAELGSPFQDFLKQAAIRVRIQRSPSDMLEALEAMECTFDCPWFVLQAFRIGLDAELVRATVLKVLRQPAEELEDLLLRVALLRSCREADILSPDDCQESPEVQRIAFIADSLRRPRKKTWIDRRISEKRAAFYRLPVKKLSKDR